MDLPTVAIANPDGGFWIINRADYDPSRHRLYDAVEIPAPFLEPSGPPSQVVELGDLSLTQLRSLASAFAIPRRSKLDRDQLIAALANTQQIKEGVTYEYQHQLSD